MDELAQVIQMIDDKIYAYKLGLQEIQPHFIITREVAEQLTTLFISDLEEIKAKLLQEG